MNKEELTKIVNSYGLYLAGEAERLELIDEIIEKMPEDIVIAEGKVTRTNDYFEDGGHIGEENVTNIFNPYEGKIIKLKIEVLDE